jgi:hypothetical protein
MQQRLMLSRRAMRRAVIAAIGSTLLRSHGISRPVQ